MQQKDLARLRENGNVHFREYTILPLTENPVFFLITINTDEILSHLSAVTDALSDTLCRKKSIPTEHRFHHIR